MKRDLLTFGLGVLIGAGVNAYCNYRSRKNKEFDERIAEFHKMASETDSLIDKAKRDLKAIDMINQETSEIQKEIEKILSEDPFNRHYTA